MLLAMRLRASSQVDSTNLPLCRTIGVVTRVTLSKKRWPMRPLSHSQISLTVSFSRGMMRINLSWRASMVKLQPTEQCVQTLGVLRTSHTRARKRKSALVNAPTGQMSVVLPENFESKPGSDFEMISHERPRLSKPSTESPAMSSWKRTQREQRIQRSRSR